MKNEVSSAISETKEERILNTNSNILKIDDAIFWEQIVKQQGAKEIKILIK